MDGVIDMDGARALVGDAALWPRVRDFLWDFAPQVHASWLDDLSAGQPGSEDPEQSRRLQVAQLPDYLTSSSPRVRRWILSRLGVEPVFHSFPKDDWSRLALLDGATLESVAKWLGALVCAGELRRVTDGATVRALKAALHGIYPEVFAFTAYFTGLNLSADGTADAKLPERVVAAGLGTIFSMLDACPAPVAGRLRLKLPKSLCGLCAPCGVKERRTADGAVRKLLKLKFPEAYTLCCS